MKLFKIAEYDLTIDTKNKIKSDPIYNIQEHDYFNIIYTEILSNTL